MAFIPKEVPKKRQLFSEEEIAAIFTDEPLSTKIQSFMSRRDPSAVKHYDNLGQCIKHVESELVPEIKRRRVEEKSKKSSQSFSGLRRQAEEVQQREVEGYTGMHRLMEAKRKEEGRTLEDFYGMENPVQKWCKSHRDKHYQRKVLIFRHKSVYNPSKKHAGISNHKGRHEDRHLYALACGFMTAFDAHGNIHLERVTEILTLNGQPTKFDLVNALKHPDICVPIRGQTMVNVERRWEKSVQFSMRKYEMAYFRKFSIKEVEPAERYEI